MSAPLLFDNVPRFLREECLWCVWIASYVDSAGVTRNGKFPCSPRTGRMIRVNDPSEWEQFDVAAEAISRNEKFTGMGILLQPELRLVGIDLDDCIADQNIITLWGTEVLSHFTDTYAEVSPSRKGIKVFGLGQLPSGMPKRMTFKGGSVEIYDRARFFTVTGWKLTEAPSAVENSQPGIDWLASLSPSQPAAPASEQSATNFPLADFYTMINECAWLQHCQSDARTLAEPEWYAMLSIVGRCKDGEEIAHDISRAHPNYTREETTAKLAQAIEKSGPRTCQDIAQSLGQAHICHACRHWNQIRSPIVLGIPRIARRRRRHPDGDLPTIQCRDRDLRDLTSESLAAIQDLNDDPQLFIRGGQMARILQDEMHRHVIGLVNEPALRGVLARAANFRAMWVGSYGQRQERPVSPPRDVVADLLALPPMTWGLPPLEGVSECPIIRPDGTAVTEEGFDDSSRVYFAKARVLTLRHADDPTTAEVHASVALLYEALEGFPFVDDASRAHAVAMMLTPILRRAIRGSVPLFVIDAPAAGTGKSLLAEITSIILTGLEAAMKPAPSYEEEEWRKTISATLLDGTSLTVFDNVAHTLQSPSLALVQTATIWTDRLLGQTKTVTLPVRTVFVVTGNNVVLGGDLPRRSLWIKLDARTAEPHKRKDFKHPKLKEWVLENRGKLLSALLTIARAWFVTGRPPAADVSVLGSFESWCETLGGILQFAGIPGFLANFDEQFKESDPSGQQWEAFLATLDEIFNGQPFTIRQILDMMEDAPHGRQHRLSSAGNEGREPSEHPLKEVWPDELADDVKKGNLQRRVGHAFRQRIGRRHGKDGYYLMKAGLATNKVARWVVIRQSGKD